MDKTPSHRHRRLDALLARTGLAHWRTPLHDLIERYAGLEDLTIGLNEGAHAEIVGLLRQMARSGEGLDDLAFARAIAELGFHEYRVCRVRDGHLDARDSWQPEGGSLAEYRAGGEVTAWPDPDHAPPAGLIAWRLLKQARRHGVDH